ncbi:hypothetical protein KY360_00670 [Candidatus Woesearchaeota archaeon]|nr:hypothetical protein [Candidatus Woesearchaeota archaeon]
MNEFEKIRLIPMILFSISYLQGIILGFLLAISKIIQKISSKNKFSISFIILVIINASILVLDYNLFYGPLVVENANLHLVLSKYVSTTNISDYYMDTYTNFKIRIIFGIAILIAYFIRHKIKNENTKAKMRRWIVFALFIYTIFNLYFLIGNYYELKKVRYIADLIQEAEQRYPDLHSMLMGFFN